MRILHVTAWRMHGDTRVAVTTDSNFLPSILIGE